MKIFTLVAASIAATAAIAMAATAVAAQDDVSLHQGVSVSSSIGVIGIEAKEWVFTGTGSTDHLSLLIWRSAAPVLTTSFDVA